MFNHIRLPLDSTVKVHTPAMCHCGAFSPETRTTLGATLTTANRQLVYKLTTPSCRASAGAEVRP